MINPHPAATASGYELWTW